MIMTLNDVGGLVVWVLPKYAVGHNNKSDRECLRTRTHKKEISVPQYETGTTVAATEKDKR